MGTSVGIVMVEYGHDVVFSVVKRGNLTALNVVGRQEWRWFCCFGCEKNVDARGCTTSGAFDAVQIVNCG
jgi:hypothetical protein